MKILASSTITLKPPSRTWETFCCKNLVVLKCLLKSLISSVQVGLFCRKERLTSPSFTFYDFGFHLVTNMYKIS